jgi:hypothetical protein
MTDKEMAELFIRTLATGLKERGIECKYIGAESAALATIKELLDPSKWNPKRLWYETAMVEEKDMGMELPVTEVFGKATRKTIDSAFVPSHR